MGERFVKTVCDFCRGTGGQEIEDEECEACHGFGWHGGTLADGELERLSTPRLTEREQAARDELVTRTIRATLKACAFAEFPVTGAHDWSIDCNAIRAEVAAALPQPTGGTKDE